MYPVTIAAVILSSLIKIIPANKLAALGLSWFVEEIPMRAGIVTAETARSKFIEMLGVANADVGKAKTAFLEILKVQGYDQAIATQILDFAIKGGASGTGTFPTLPKQYSLILPKLLYPVVFSAFVDSVYSYREDIYSFVQQRASDLLDYSLYKAMRLHKNNVVKLILRLGANPDELDVTLEIILNGKEDANGSLRREIERSLNRPVVDGEKDIVELLLNAGANANAFYKEINWGWPPDGSTTLHKAVEVGNKDAVKLLLKYKADPNVRDYMGWTPLSRVAGDCSADRVDIVRLLLEYKADVRIRSTFTVEPLDLVVLSDSGECAEVVELLLKAGADPNARGVHGKTSLHNAIALGQYKIVELLLNFGADASIRDEEGKTPLDYLEREILELDIVDFIGNSKLEVPTTYTPNLAESVAEIMRDISNTSMNVKMSWASDYMDSLYCDVSGDHKSLSGSESE